MGETIPQRSSDPQAGAQPEMMMESESERMAAAYMLGADVQNAREKAAKVESFPFSPDYTPSSEEVKRFLRDPRFDLQMLRFLYDYRQDERLQFLIQRDPEIMQVIRGYLRQEEISVLKILACSYLINSDILILPEARKTVAKILASNHALVSSVEFIELQSTIRSYDYLKSPEERMADEKLRQESLSPADKQIEELKRLVETPRPLSGKDGTKWIIHNPDVQERMQTIALGNNDPALQMWAAAYLLAADAPGARDIAVSLQDLTPERLPDAGVPELQRYIQEYDKRATLERPNFIVTTFHPSIEELKRLLRTDEFALRTIEAIGWNMSPREVYSPPWKYIKDDSPIQELVKSYAAPGNSVPLRVEAAACLLNMDAPDAMDLAKSVLTDPAYINYEGNRDDLSNLEYMLKNYETRIRSEKQ